MRYTTVALRLSTKKRIDQLRRTHGFRSMDEAIAAAVGRMELDHTLAEARRAARGWERQPRDPRIEAFEEAVQGFEETRAAVRKGWKRNARKRARQSSGDARKQRG